MELDMMIEVLKVGGVPAVSILAIAWVVRQFLSQLRSMTDSGEAESGRFRTFVSERDEQMKDISERCHSNQDRATEAILACAKAHGENTAVQREVVAAVSASRATQQELLAWLRMQHDMAG